LKFQNVVVIATILSIVMVVVGLFNLTFGLTFLSIRKQILSITTFSVLLGAGLLLVIFILLALLRKMSEVANHSKQLFLKGYKHE